MLSDMPTDGETMIETAVLEMLILNIPNFAGLVFCVYVLSRVISRLLDKIDRCDCDPVDSIDPANDSA